MVESYEEEKDNATIKSDELIESLDYERKKRGFIQYNTPEKIKLARVQTSLKRAKIFFLVKLI